MLNKVAEKSKEEDLHFFWHMQVVSSGSSWRAPISIRDSLAYPEVTGYIAEHYFEEFEHG